MGNVISSTADILAIIGGATTLVLGVFGAIRYSRCRSVSCCFSACVIENSPPPDQKKSSPVGEILREPSVVV
jgi:hypothetical protein